MGRHLPIMKMKDSDILADRKDRFEGGTERILMVDDEETVIRIGQQMLEWLGYQVNTQTVSIDALEVFKANPDSFDLVITDMTMPNMNGVQFAGKIKKIRSDIPVILCTGFNHQVDDEKSKALGVQGFVTKPFIMREIAMTIRTVLNVEKPADA